MNSQMRQFTHVKVDKLLSVVFIREKGKCKETKITY